MRGKVSERCSNPASLLAGIDARGCPAESGVAPVANLDADHDIALAHDQVDFASTVAHVACDDTKPLASQKSARLVLSAPA